ncbi:hypothetical protein BDR06DRAFT_316195 [Suillus hirtellus]|nr:hypothetical protein BDR06DRAFT_316195 [Suillus hirtellus]
MGHRLPVFVILPFCHDTPSILMCDRISKIHGHGYLPFPQTLTNLTIGAPLRRSCTYDPREANVGRGRFCMQKEVTRVIFGSFCKWSIHV